MTPIERAVAALKESLGAQEHPGLDPVRDVIVDGRCDMLEAVRTVIAAIREPSEGMVTAGEMKTDTYYSQDGDVARGWQAMIDAMLSETP